MNILFIGDIVGRQGREAIAELLPQIIEEFNIEFCIANAENAAGGAGITPKIIDELARYSVDILTSGDHVWDRRELLDEMDNKDRLVRPANYTAEVPGTGCCVVEKADKKIGVLNLQGRVFMAPVVENPFKSAENLVAQLKEQTSVIIVDMHAEATSEKVAMGHFLDGKVSAVIGTHTHIQTADEKILPKGTAYITDCGMAGPCDSVIGQRKEKIIQRFLTGLPIRFEVASDDIQLHGVIINIDEKTGKANSIKRLQRGLK